MTFDDFYESGKGFMLLDVRLMSAVTGIASGSIGLKITKANAKAAKNGQVMKGRQALHLMYKHFKCNQDKTAFFDLKDLIAVKYREGETSLQQFMDNWDVVYDGMDYEPDETTLVLTFFEETRKCSQLDYDLSLIHI